MVGETDATESGATMLCEQGEGVSGMFYEDFQWSQVIELHTERRARQGNNELVPGCSLYSCWQRHCLYWLSR